MLRRAYDPEENNKHKTYRDVTVCEEWHDYQNFHDWFEENYYVLDTAEEINLDKDIAIRGNKEYSPSACSYVPQSINKLLLTREASRGSLPQGVILFKPTGKYRACLKVDGKNVYLGYYNSPGEAFYHYKIAKEGEVARKASLYKDVLPSKIYNALINYRVL